MFEGGPELLFAFININGPGDDSSESPRLCWTLANIWGTNARMDQIILRAQTSSVHAWLDSLKTIDAVVECVDDLPLDLMQHADILQQHV